MISRRSPANMDRLGIETLTFSMETALEPFCPIKLRTLKDP